MLEQPEAANHKIYTKISGLMEFEALARSSGAPSPRRPGSGYWPRRQGTRSGQKLSVSATRSSGPMGLQAVNFRTWRRQISRSICQGGFPFRVEFLGHSCGLASRLVGVRFLARFVAEQPFGEEDSAACERCQVSAERHGRCPCLATWHCSHRPLDAITNAPHRSVCLRARLHHPSPSRSYSESGLNSKVYFSVSPF
jgi:hypothetical protein